MLCILLPQGLSDESTLTPGRMEAVDTVFKKTKNGEKPVRLCLGTFVNPQSGHSDFSMLFSHKYILLLHT